MSGTLFIISAPSGGGKTSLITALVEEMPNLVISLSYTTRVARPGEIDGVHYQFVSQETYDALVAQNAFLETAEVFGHDYGTSRDWVKRHLQQGFDVLLEIDWQGAAQIKKQFANESCSIFILPPSLAALESRLRVRKQDTNEVIQARMEKATAEMVHYSEYDYVVVNEDFHNARRDLKSIVTAERLKCARQQERHQAMLTQLLS